MLVACSPLDFRPIIVSIMRSLAEWDKPLPLYKGLAHGLMKFEYRDGYLKLTIVYEDSPNTTQIVACSLLT